MFEPFGAVTTGLKEVSIYSREAPSLGEPLMRTITFYSYKGGVGRSLLVANAAKYLSTLGKNVFALDLDLEAPGLLYKFELGPDAVHSASAHGVVDILANFLDRKVFPESLEEYSSILK